MTTARDRVARGERTVGDEAEQAHCTRHPWRQLHGINPPDETWGMRAPGVIAALARLAGEGRACDE